MADRSLVALSPPRLLPDATGDERLGLLTSDQLSVPGWLVRQPRLTSVTVPQGKSRSPVRHREQVPSGRRRMSRSAPPSSPTMVDYVCRVCGTRAQFTPLLHLQPPGAASGVKGMMNAFAREAHERGLCTGCLNDKRRKLRDIVEAIEEYSR